MKKSKILKSLLVVGFLAVLTSCDSDIVNLPSNKGDNLVNIITDPNGDVTNNTYKDAYGNLSTSSKNEYQLNTILDDFASEYLTDDFAIDEDSITEKVEDKFMDVAKGTSYNDDYYQFQEFEYALSLVKQGYVIKTSDGKTDIDSLKAAANTVLVTPESEYSEVFSLDYTDYIDRSIKPEIKRQFLYARYIYENAYSSIGTTNARNITAVKITDRTDKPGEATKLVQNFVNTYLKNSDASVEQADLKRLSRMWKGASLTEEDEADLLNWNVSNLADQIEEEIGKIGTPTWGTDSKGNKTLESIALFNQYKTDSSLLSTYTGSNAYTVEKGYLLAVNKLAQTENYYDDTYLNTDSISSFPDDLKTTIFDSNYSIKKDDAKDNTIEDNSWVVMHKGEDGNDVQSRYVLAKRSETKGDIATYSSSDSSYYIVQINTIVTTGRIAISGSDSDEVKAAKRSLAMESAYIMAKSDSYKKNAITYYLKKKTISYSDPDFYTYIDTNYPDVIDN